MARHAPKVIVAAALLSALGMAVVGPSAAAENEHFVLVAPDGVLAAQTPIEDTRARLNADHAVLRESDAPEIVKWRAAVDDLTNMDPWIQVREVNRRANAHVTYTEDWVGYGKQDFWATPSETLIRGTGDCEDVALLKIVTLRHLGWAVRDVALAVGWLTRGDEKVGHALAAVTIGDTVLLLDNLTDEIGPAVDHADYTPVYVASNDGSWLVLDQRQRD